MSEPSKDKPTVTSTAATGRRWQNKKWAIIFLTVAGAYFIYVIYLIYAVYKDSDKFLSIDQSRLPDYAKGLSFEDSSEGKSGGLAIEQPAPVDLNIALMLAGSSLIALGCSMLLLFAAALTPTALVWTGPVLIVTATTVAGFAQALQIAEAPSTAPQVQTTDSKGRPSYRNEYSTKTDWMVGTGVAFGAAALTIFICWLPPVRTIMRRATVMLGVVGKIGREHISVYILVVFGVVLQTFLVVLSIVAVISAFLRFYPWSNACSETTCGWGLAICSILFLAFAQNWIGGTVSNIIITTLAGGYYSAWFQELNPKDQVKNTTASALKAACTLSLGSLALNAVIVDLIELAAFLLESIIDMIPCVNKTFASCLGCIINLVASLLEMFNRYVCIVIGVNDFQLSYGSAAKRTYAFAKRGPMFEAGRENSSNMNEKIRKKMEKMGPMKKIMRSDRQNRLMPEHFGNGLGALINDIVVAQVIAGGSLACGLIGAFGVYIYMQVLDTADGAGMKLAWWEYAFVIYAFFSAIFIASILGKSLEAGVSTLYVCIYDPPGLERHGSDTRETQAMMSKIQNMLREKAPDIHKLFVEEYPSAFCGIMKESSGGVASDKA